VLNTVDIAALRTVARHDEPDRYLAALLAPEPQRTALLAIAAFSAELRRIPRLVSDPMIGEIRLQWWRDAIAAFDQGGTTGHPISDALGDAVRRFHLPPALLIAMTEARAFDLYNDPMPDAASLDGYLAKTEGVPFELAFRVVAARSPVGSEVAILNSVGRSFGLARLIGDLPHHLARGRCPLPPQSLAVHGLPLDALLHGARSDAATALIQQHCDDAMSVYVALRPQVAQWSRDSRLAVLPMAVVPAYLQAVRSQKRHPLREPVDLAPFARVWRIASGRLIGRL
jgi:15-cis-phytoene synthase